MSATTDRLSTSLADRYRIERELGAGGMATVYLAHDIKHERKVALKVLKPELAAVIGAERFLGEIRTTANLQHPHILALFDSGQVDGTVFYVMPYVEGESLRDRLSREKQLPIPEAIRIATEIAGALSYAHRHGVIHRDIKPENILLHDGQALVADFGIALAASSTGGGRLTETGMSLGTPTYMSPEQAMGERTIDGRTDIYALGCVLYEMLVGDPPHIGSTAQAIVAKVLTERPASIIAQRDRVPSHVEAAVLMALSKLPADRFEGAKQFADALNDPSKAPTSIHPANAGRRSSRRLIGWGAAIVGAAVLGYLVAPGSTRAASASDSAQPVLRFEVDLPVALGNDQFNILPDGSGLLVLGGGPQGYGIYLLRFADTLPRYLSATDAMIGMYATHDVSGIAYYTWPGIGLSRVRLVSMEGGPSRTVTDSVRLGLALDDAGSLYGSHHQHFGLTRVSSDGSRMEVLTRPDTTSGESTHAWPDLLPNGRGVLFEIAYRTDRPPELAVYDLRRNEVRRLISGSRPRYLENGFLVFNAADGVVAAVRFDAERLTIQGTPVPVLARSSGYTISRNGTLAQREITERSWSLVRVASGSVTTIARGDGAPPSSFRLHADGRMAVSTGRGISFYAADGTERPLSLPNGVDIGGWHEGGHQLAFIRSLTAGERRVTREAQSVPSDGSAPPSALFREGVRIPPGLRDLDLGASGVVFSASGRAWWLAQGDSVPVDLGALTNRPRLSPDGRFIALERGEQTGAQQVVVLAVPPATGRWEVGTGSRPRWSGDGRFLYFAGPTREYQQAATPVMRVAVRPGEAFSFGAVTPVADPPPGATVAWEVGPRDGAIHWITAPVGRHAIVTANWSRVVDSLVRAAERTR